MKNFQILATLIGARLNCINKENIEWRDKHEARIEEIVRESFPRGSGFDKGTEIDLERSTDEKLIFNVSFHHMDENGMYDGWTEHEVTVRPSLAHEFLLTISGRDKNQIKEYMMDEFNSCLDQEEDKVPRLEIKQADAVATN
jgi:hypothetical protein